MSEAQAIILLEFSQRTPDIAEMQELLEFMQTDQEYADIPDEQSLSFASNAYLERFKARLIDSNKFDNDEIATIMKHARAYAGGVASGLVRRDKSDSAPESDDDSLPSSIAAHESYMQMPVVTDVLSFSMPADASVTPWMQITPRAGSSFRHPQYGMVTFDKSMAGQLVDNFNSRVYQEHIPIDSEHATKLSGALGYYRELRMRPDGAVEARIELTERGKTLRTSGGLRYFSPEFFRSWTDPATGQEHKNLLVGGAFTTRPFFKDAHLAPLAASEQFSVITGGKKMSDSIWLRDEDGALVLDADGDPQLTEAATAEATANEAAATAAIEAAERRAVESFCEAHNLNADGTPRDGTEAARAFAEQFPEQARAFAELQAANDALVEGARRLAFRDVVLGRDPSGDGSKPFLGDAEKHVNFLVSLSERYGEQSDEVDHYIAMNREHAAQMATSGIFSERGSSASSATVARDPEERAEKMANERMKANPGMAFGEALDEVLRENPGIYNESIG